jgi:undecaprenyl-diphosphatase
LIASWKRHHWELLVMFVAGLALAYVFLKLGSEIHEGELAGLDRAVRGVAMRMHSPLLDAFFWTITSIGEKYVQVPLAAFVAWLVSRRNLTIVALLMLCGLVASEFVDVIKAFFVVIRPTTGLLERHSTSFPSGHVTGTMAMALFLGFVAARNERHARIVWGVGGSLVILMAASRVYLDMHWTSDVIGGALIGAAIGLAFSALYEWMRQRGLIPDVTTLQKEGARGFSRYVRY